MYTLLSGLYKHITQKDEYFVLILGLDNAGKTTLLEAAKTRLVPNHQGANLQKITTTRVAARLPEEKREDSSSEVKDESNSPVTNKESSPVLRRRRERVKEEEGKEGSEEVKSTERGEVKEVGLNLGKIDTNGVRLNFWDLGGQEELQALWDKYYQECHAIIYVVDSSDRERIEQSKETFNSMIKNEHVRGVPLLVAANKQDLVDCMGVREVKPLFEGNLELVGGREVMTLATSGLAGDGVVEGIDWVAQCVVRNEAVRPPHGPR